MRRERVIQAGTCHHLVARVAKGESKGLCRYDKESLLWQSTVAVKSDPVASEDDLQELRIVDVFDGGHPFVDEIVSCLKRDDFPPGSYTFCGILCHVVCEVNGVPACVAEILQDGKTVYISVPFGSEPGMVYKKDGSYFVKDNLTPIAHPCYSIPELVEKVSCLVSDSFKEQERSGCHKVELFKPSDR